MREGGADKRRGGGDQEGKGRRVVAVSDRRRPIDQRATADDRHIEALIARAVVRIVLRASTPDYSSVVVVSSPSGSSSSRHRVAAARRAQARARRPLPPAADRRPPPLIADDDATPPQPPTPNTIAKQGKPPPSCAAAVVVAVPGIIAAAAVDALLPVEGVDGAQQETRERANASKQCVSHHLCDVLGAHALRRAPRIFAAPILVRELRLAVPGQAHRLVRWVHLRGLRSLSCAHQRNTKTRVPSYMSRRCRCLENSET